MLRALPFLALAVLAILPPREARAWGNEGHETVGILAERHLAGTRAEAEVRKLLRPGESLARAAVWADEIKRGGNDAESNAFVRDNPTHATWHYTDVPWQYSAYREDAPGARPDDLPHLFARCIRILQGKSDDADNPTKITPRVALLLVAHFAGDIAQPFHVGAGFIAENRGRWEFVDPSTLPPGAKFYEDAGGNGLRFGADSLHFLWDVYYVQQSMQRATGGLATDVYATWLLKNRPVTPEWSAELAAWGNDPAAWPFAWATDTLKYSKPAYTGITLGARTEKPERREPGKFRSEWPAQIPSDYSPRAQEIVSGQLAKAGWRLAALLRAIWPDDPKASPPIATPTASPSAASTPASAGAKAALPSPRDDAESQRRAVEKYPALADAGSPLNREFVRRYGQLRAKNPTFSRDPAWPEKLADECAAALGR